MNKENTLFRFLGLIILFSIFAGGITVFLLNRYHIAPKPTINNIIGLCMFFIFTTSLVYTMVSMAKNKKPQKLVTYFMGATTLKLLLSLLFLAVYAFTHKETAKVFIVLFFIYYMLYTAFEVAALILQVKKKENTSKT